MPTVSELRLKFLTLRHYLHQQLLVFLARPDAPQILKVVGGVAVVIAVFIVWNLSSAIAAVISYHRDPISYLREFYNPDTPRYVDTSAFRTPEHKIMDFDAYKNELFKLNQYNTYLSDKTPINRKTKDPRSEGCRMRARSLTPDDKLAPTSIIIIMHNEELSALLRTLISILNNTPMNSLKEIILVDDKSNRFELGSQLDKELRQFPFVRLIRNSKREGLIRSRIIGAKAAVGKILIFLDSHVEALEGWYQPIVSRIMEDPKTVVCPIIVSIDHTTMEVHANGGTSVWGGFDWDMKFTWEPLPPRENQRRGFDDAAPIRSPTMAGGLFGMDKDYFFELGAYDPGMKIWGGENMEMSFRIWMCGGAIEINTCSFVGHIFRKPGMKQSTPVEETALQQNVKRVVEVWLDDYKEAFYNAAPSHRNVAEGDTVSRTLLRQRLKCRSFSWFLREVYPDKPRPGRDFIAYGQVKGPGDQCMDSMGIDPGRRVGVYACHGKGYAQFWKFHLNGVLMNGDHCLDGDGTNPRNVVMFECHGLGGNQQWFLTEDGRIQHAGSGKCLTHDGRFLMLLDCDDDERFVWKFNGMSEELLEKFYVIYSKQFGYFTKKQKEENKKKAEQDRLERKKQLEERNKEKERKQIEEAAAKKAEEERIRREEERAKDEADKAKAAEKAKEEEKKKALEKELEELREWKRMKAEKQKREEEKQKQLDDELEKMRKEQELERKRREKEIEDMKREKELEEMKREKELEEKRRLAEERKELEGKKKEEEERKKELKEKLRDEERKEKETEKKSEEESAKGELVQQENKDYKSIENEPGEKDDSAIEYQESDKKEANEDVEMKEFLAWKAKHKKS